MKTIAFRIASKDFLECIKANLAFVSAHWHRLIMTSQAETVQTILGQQHTVTPLPQLEQRGSQPRLLIEDGFA